MANKVIKTKGVVQEIPKEFTEDVIDTIKRIVSDSNVLGVLYFRHFNIQMCTVPQSMVRPLCKELPKFTQKVNQAITEIDILDELLAYRIESLTSEIIVVGGVEVGACVVQKRTTTTGNKKNKRGKINFLAT